MGKHEGHFLLGEGGGVGEWRKILQTICHNVKESKTESTPIIQFDQKCDTHVTSYSMSDFHFSFKQLVFQWWIIQSKRAWKEVGNIYLWFHRVFYHPIVAINPFERYLMSKLISDMYVTFNLLASLVDCLDMKI